MTDTNDTTDGRTDAATNEQMQGWGLNPRQQRLAAQELGRQLIAQEDGEAEESDDTDEADDTDLEAVIEAHINDDGTVDMEGLAEALQAQFITQADLEAQLHHIVETHQAEGLEAVAQLDDVHPTLKQAYLEHDDVEPVANVGVSTFPSTIAGERANELEGGGD